MKSLITFCILFILIINTFCFRATPIITNLITSQVNNVELYSKFEISFDLNDYANPYDESIINVFCEFWSPSGEYFKVYAFYYQDFVKTNQNCTPYPCEVLNSNNEYCWKIRFTPDEIGKWQYKLTAADNSGSITYPSNSLLNFKCISSSNLGFITKANNKFLKRTSGQFYFPVGENLAWYNSPDFWGQQTFGTNEFIYYIDKLANNKVNFIRVFLDVYEGMALVGYDYTTQTNYYNLYNQKDAFQLDQIINYAKTKDVNIMLCLFSHASWGDSSYCNNNWSTKNPFYEQNNGPLTTPFEFFTNNSAISATKKMIKSIVSRWGFATNIVSWELWNEVNEIKKFNPSLTPPITFENDIYNWHLSMYNYIKSLDPFNHLITSSNSGDSIISANSIYSIMDYSQSHDYKDPVSNNSDDFQNHFFQVAKDYLDTFNKPYMNGEWGFTESNIWLQHDPNAFELHNSLWSSAFSTAFGAVSNWWWDGYINQNNLFSLYKPISVFMNSLSIPSESFNSFKIHNVNGIRTYYMKNSNSDTIYGWAQDMNFHFQSLKSTENGINYLQTFNQIYRPNPSSSNNEIIIPVTNNNNTYIVKWYNALTGLEYQTSYEQSSNSSIKINIPQDLRSSEYGDAVFAIYLDCDKNIWREGILNDNTYTNVNGNVVCNKNNSQVFYKTFDDRINSIWWDDTSNTWKWSGLNNSAINVAGDLTISINGTEVFYRTIDNNINSIYWDTIINNWLGSNLNQVTNGNVKGPISVSSNNQVFYRNNDDKLNNIWKNPSTGLWEWSNLNNSTNSNVGNSIAISSDSKVFYKTTDSKLNGIYWNPSSGNWVWSNLNNSVNGNVSGNLHVSPNGQVFYRTNDKKINNIWLNSSTGNWEWSNLNNSSSNVAGDIMSDNYGKIFYRTIDSDLNCIYFMNNSWQWSSLDNAAITKIKQGNIAIDNFSNVFFRGFDNKIHRIYFKSQCFSIESPYFQKNESDTLLTLENINESTINVDNVKLIIYPNPAFNEVTLVAQEPLTNIYLFDLNGNLINEISNIKVNAIDFDISNYQSGFYFLMARFANGSYSTEKFIIN
jgi:hypothetical protein